MTRLTTPCCGAPLLPGGAAQSGGGLLAVRGRLPDGDEPSRRCNPHSRRHPGDSPMTLADDIRKATEGVDEGLCGYVWKGDGGGECGLPEESFCHPCQHEPHEPWDLCHPFTEALLVRALRVVEAAERVSKEAEADDDFEGCYTDWIIPDETMNTLRAALRGDR